ncbi:DUF4365 domain-containing protein [Mycobacterium haemophilum]
MAVATGKGQAPPPALPSVLRGSEKRITDLMEAFQESYVRGVAAASGCVIVGKPEIDEGIDLVLSHRHDNHQKDKFAYLQIQMKATADGLVENGKFIKTSLRNDRYELFRNDDPSIHRIVVILHVPESQADWLRVGEKALLLHHHAYWVSIEGQAASSAERVTVKAPTTQVFDDVALCRIMARIGQGGAP